MINASLQSKREEQDKKPKRESKEKKMKKSEWGGAERVFENVGHAPRRQNFQEKSNAAIFEGGLLNCVIEVKGSFCFIFQGIRAESTLKRQWSPVHGLSCSAPEPTRVGN